tara:strand:+ start:412 stop:651 length:240 start_codon:yes stop_codon:yes gene_type:complete
MDKNKVIELLGDIAWFSGILILQSNMYNEIGTKEDSETIAVMLRNLSKEIGLTKEDIIAIETIADNKLKEQLNGKIEKV